MNERTFSFNGFTLKAIESGRGQERVIVALHGWLDNAATFNELRKHFTDYHFIALDLAGHGLSDHRPPQMPYYIWDNVSDLLEVIEQLNTAKVTLIGHSMGASVASLFASAFPDRIDKLFLIDGLAPVIYKTDELPEQLTAAILKRRKMADKSLRPYDDVESAVQARMRGRWPVTRQGAEWLVERGLKRVDEGYVWRSDPNLMLPSLVRFSEDQVRAFLANIPHAVRLYLGDGGIYEDVWRERIDLMQNVSFVTLAGGHHLHLEPNAAQEIATDIKVQI